MIEGALPKDVQSLAEVLVPLKIAVEDRGLDFRRGRLLYLAVGGAEIQAGPVGGLEPTGAEPFGF